MIRVIIDMSGGVFNGATATEATEVLVIDSEDRQNPRALVPGYGGTKTEVAPIWAGLEDAEVDALGVNAAFDGIAWLND